MNGFFIQSICKKGVKMGTLTSMRAGVDCLGNRGQRHLP